MSCSGASRYLRKVHAAEIFRSSFSKAQGGVSSISAKDLDDLVHSHQVRPSLTVGAAEISGSLLGATCRIIPHNLSRFIVGVVDEAVQIQFNDSIRDLGSYPDEEIKEAFKFHRDFNIVEKDDGNSQQRGNMHHAALGAVIAVLNVAERI
jgi:demethoxyubiquinone hydroxylase (CLK1/Coq7/Cat5 family)